MIDIKPMNRAEKDELELMIKEEIGRRVPDRALIVCMKTMQKITMIEDAVVEIQEMLEK